MKGVLKLICSVFPNRPRLTRLPLNTCVLFPPMLQAKFGTRVFQSAGVVDNEIVQLPEFIAVALKLIGC